MKIIHITPTAATATATRLSFPNTVLFFLSLLLITLLAPSIALADRGYDDQVVTTDPERIVRESAPLWLLPQGTCIPDSAVKDGVQNNGTDTDLCRLYGSLDAGCPAQAPFNGPYTKSTAFPTYYHFRFCPNINQIRILYDMYYPKDTGHRHDWEWAVITFKQRGENTDWRWHREHLILQNEGTNSVFPWDDIPEAYSEGDNFRNNAGPNGDHPKLYVGKFHHSVHTDPYTSIWTKFKCAFNAAPVYGNWDYRDSDYYFPAQEWLVNGNLIRKDWTWGTSDSPPPSFFSDGNYDICYLRVDATS